MLPLQDTRPGLSDHRVGHRWQRPKLAFWLFLERLHRVTKALGGVDFAAPYDTDWDEVEDEMNVRLVERNHPGVGTLTTMEVMRDNYRDPTMETAVGAQGTSRCGPTLGSSRSSPPPTGTRPRWSAGLTVPPVSRSAWISSLAGAATSRRSARPGAARRLAYIEVVDHQPGTAWLIPRSQYLTRDRYKSSDIAFDKISEGEATYIASRYVHPRPRFRLRALVRDRRRMRHAFMRELEAETLRHFAAQGCFNSAVMVAKKRRSVAMTGRVDFHRRAGSRRDHAARRRAGRCVTGTRISPESEATEETGIISA